MWMLHKGVYLTPPPPGSGGGPPVMAWIPFTLPLLSKPLVDLNFLARPTSVPQQENFPFARQKISFCHPCQGLLEFGPKKYIWPTTFWQIILPAHHFLAKNIAGTPLFGK